MFSRFRTLADYLMGLVTIIILAFYTWLNWGEIHPDLSWLVFISLSAFTSAYAVPLGGGFMSLLPLTMLSALLTLGTIEAGYVAVIGELLFGFLRWRFARQLGRAGERSLQETLRLTFANMAIQGLSVMSAGLVYTSLGGKVPLASFGLQDLERFLVVTLTYLAVNYVLISGYMLLRGWQTLKKFLLTIRNLIPFEGLPIILSPLMAMIYSKLGLSWMFLFATNLAAASLIARFLAGTSERLEKRVKELGTLQAVGKTLSSTLDLETVLKEIYRLVSELMPADVFYIALFDSETNQISFPLVIENGVEIHWRSRRAGDGLTEFVIHERRPLLLSRQVMEQLTDLGVASYGRVAESWLGVPMIVGDEAIGLLSVQSYTQPGVYTPALEQVLVTVAAQAGMAVHNARLYARVDETLERRVRELNSILHTTANGILLFNPDLLILTANPAMGAMLGLDSEEIVGIHLGDSVGTTSQSVMNLLGYTPELLEGDLAALANGQTEFVQKLIQRDEIAFHRVITPVANRDEQISGWLLVTNDRTEELALEHLRDDMLHMIVHDLRAPLTSLIGSLAMLREGGSKAGHLDVDFFYDIAERSGQRMLGLVNTILDISALESKSLPVRCEPHTLTNLLKDVIGQFQPALREARLDLLVEIPENLPHLMVDGEMVRRVIANLVDNAIKFSPEQSYVTISAAQAQKPGWLEIRVTDQGAGISPEIRSALFQKFRSDRRSPTRRKGSGLGLYFCRLAVEAHGGNIWVESQDGSGSTFHILLPALLESQ